MTTKIISASKILEAKGYRQPKFYQQGFNALVAKFFESHDVKDTIMLYPKRFVEWLETANIPSEEYTGYRDYTDPGIWERKAEDPNDPLDFLDYVVARNKGLIRPIIFVDEPFCKNAAYMLSVMCGFTVKKQAKGKFLVSLV